jgi:hypothetical protein
MKIYQVTTIDLDPSDLSMADGEYPVKHSGWQVAFKFCGETLHADLVTNSIFEAETRAKEWRRNQIASIESQPEWICAH